MKTKFQSFTKPAFVLWISCSLSVVMAQPGSYDKKAKQILDAAGRSDQAAAYVAVGRSSYLDGGMNLYRFDPRTGKVLSKTKIDNRDPETDLPPQDTARGVNMPGALPDVLSRFRS